MDVIERGRAFAEQRFTDTFTAYAFETIEIDDLQEQVWVEQYVTPGHIASRSRYGDGSSRTVTVGGVERIVLEGGLHIPLSAPLPIIGMEFVCTAVGTTSDPALLGQRWRVVDVLVKSHATARRLDVVEIPQGA